MQTKLSSILVRFGLALLFATSFTLSAAARIESFPFGTLPHGLAFDGANIWIANGGDQTVTKLRATDGTLLATYTGPHGPAGLAFDGHGLWIACSGTDAVHRLSSNGAKQRSSLVEDFPLDLVFDGSAMWVTNLGSNTVSKITQGQ